jgi:integrase
VTARGLPRKEVQIADIRIKRDKSGEPVAWLVRWIEGGKQRYKQFRVEAEALAFKQTKEHSDFDKMMDAAHGRRPGRYESSGQQWERSARGVWSVIGYGGPGEADEERWSVAGYARRMVEADGDLANATRFTYLRTIQRHFEETPLGRADVRYVTTEQVRDWWTSVPEGGRWDAYRLLSKTINRAVLVGDRENNPLKRAPEVRKPRRRREIDFDPLSADQIEDLADAAARRTPGKGFQGRVGEMVRQRDRLLILVMGFAGLRAGEAGGVRRQDLLKTADGRCQLRVRQQVVRDTPKEPPRVAPLKTSASRRTITIACSLWEELVAFADEFGTAADGRVLHGPNGEMRDHSLINGSVRAAAKRAGMPGIHSHLLRHSAVSLLIDAGANPKQVQAFAGHASITMTLGVYGHLFDQAGAELGEIMEGLREAHRNGG